MQLRPNFCTTGVHQTVQRILACEFCHLKSEMLDSGPDIVNQLNSSCNCTKKCLSPSSTIKSPKTSRRCGSVHTPSEQFSMFPSKKQPVHHDFRVEEVGDAQAAAQEDGSPPSSKLAQPSSARDAAGMCTTDHLPPTSKANTTKRDCQVPPTLGISALCAVWPQGRSRRCVRSPHCEVNSRSEGIIPTSCPLPAAPAEQWQAVHNHFQPTAISGVEHREIQVTDHYICGPPYTRCSTLSANPRRPNSPVLGHEARWWPNESIGRPQPHVCGERGSGRRRRRNRTTLNKCVESSSELTWGLCERTQTRSRSDNRSKSTSSLCCRSTREEASCCQPPRSIPGSNSSGSNIRGRTPSHNACHDGGSNPWCRSMLWQRTLHQPEMDCQGGLPTAGRSETSPQCLANIMGKQSAQLAQYAETLVHVALLRPTPPNTSGRLSSSCVTLMFRRAHMQSKHLRHVPWHTPAQTGAPPR